MNNNDFEFISSKFEEEGIKAPESLSAENIINGFDKKNVNNIVKINKNKRGVKSFVAVAACIALVITSVAIGGKYLREPVKVNEPVNTASDVKLEGITYFSSYDELEKTIKEIAPDERNIIEKGLGTITNNFSKSADAVSEESAADGLSAPSSASSFAKTNTQVEAVDEADIIKTDGKYIYYLTDDENRTIRIYSADKGETKLVSTIEISDKNDRFFHEMYINGDKLIAIGSYTESKDDYELNTFLNIYDISDRKEPELVKEYAQSGAYSTSRMYGSCVYLISNYAKFYYKKGFIPYVYCDGEKGDLPVENICAVEECKSTNYAVIGAVSLDGKTSKQNTKAVLGVSEDVYCNEKNLYLTGVNYNYGEACDDNYEKTQIIKYSFDKTKVELKASGKVKGYINNQFSLDEKDGKLRVATTASNWENGNEKNYLFIFDEKLEKIGEVTGFAKGEQIKAVRYLGDTAYVITFEQTDPLFVIDLSDPKNPEIKGEVKIDGFSSSLTPVDENTLLGIGYSTKVNEYGGVQTNGLKLVVFDISDKEHPKTLSEKELINRDSPVQYNHKALCINRDRGYFAIPYYSYNDYGDDDSEVENAHNSVGIVRVNNGKIEFTELDCGKEDEVARCTYIDDYLYAVLSESGEIQSFNIK